MHVIVPGHVYALTQYELPQEEINPVMLRFVNKEVIPYEPGTRTQEVLRALIDRTQHCNKCLPWGGNELIIQHLRAALVLHEARALERKVEKRELKPELIEVSVDGHFLLTTNIK